MINSATPQYVQLKPYDFQSCGRTTPAFNLLHSRLPYEQKDDTFVFYFDKRCDAIEFVYCVLTVSLFRRGKTNKKNFKPHYLAVAQVKFPELFFNDFCSLPIRAKTIFRDPLSKP